MTFVLLCHHTQAGGSDGRFRAPGRRFGPLHRVDGKKGNFGACLLNLYFCVMEKPTYPIESSENGYWYEFESVSDQKIIKKAVGFYPYRNDEALVELVFGDMQPNGSLDVYQISNNNDMPIIIATVVQTIYRFLELYPDKIVTFIGSSASRNRLYRGIISKILMENSSEIEVLGLTFDNQLELFLSNKDYFSFLIKLKS